ncbi:MAG TPA: hypothetical protein VFL47_06880, partial [Flavisolibacter sp.]|nr:hypothetical protein [Flavisolibacter sp.]
QNQPVDIWYFPGVSQQKALVIGGIHGSELSSVAVANQLIRQLQQGKKPYYSVVVIPSLFPDNARVAEKSSRDRVPDNKGRYTAETTADPNRQMPAAGQPFLLQDPTDAMSRPMETEIRALLQVIQVFRPDRLLSIHAIRDQRRAGIFADPRTDCSGMALGFDTDEELALLMAEHIETFGGACPGNQLDSVPTALYYLDPAIALPGQKQLRSFQLGTLVGKGRGVSLGTWCSTAVCSGNRELSRPAIRTFTIEFPGYFTPDEYTAPAEQQKYRQLVSVYAASVQRYFLEPFHVERKLSEEQEPFASR